ncbi:MAG: asparaginase [Thalassobaculales bacterium]
MLDDIARVHLAAGSVAPIAVEVTRGGMVESFHRCIAAVVDASGRVLHRWGDIERPIYPRSAIKPLQTLALLETGAAERFGCGDDEVTLACASHHGEPMHTDRVAAWLGRIGLDIEDLECGPQLPYHEDTARALIRAGQKPTRAHNNCSGKHSGFLTTAVHLGEPTRGYTSADHPVQQRLIAIMAEMGGVDLSRTARGVDGCGIPVYGVPLVAMATALARLADPSGLPAERAAACRRVRRACAAHPLLISGTGTFNSALLAATGEDCLLKGGAEGCYAASVGKLGLGVAVKVDDGAGRAASVAMAAILAHLGILDAARLAGLAAHVAPEVRNWAGTLVGRIRPVAELPF